MKHRSPIAVFLLPFVTFGIYGLYWEVKTKGEMTALGADIPTAWLIIVPFVNIWWLWKYSQGVEHVTGGKLSGVLSFVMLWLLGSIGAAIIQDSFNNNVAVAAPVVGAAAEAPVDPTPPAPEAPTTVTPSVEQQPPTNPVQ